jgi:hypothetical protein
VYARARTLGEVKRDLRLHERASLPGSAGGAGSPVPHALSPIAPNGAHGAAAPSTWIERRDDDRWDRPEAERVGKPPFCKPYGPVILTLEGTESLRKTMRCIGGILRKVGASSGNAREMYLEYI